MMVRMSGQARAYLMQERAYFVRNDAMPAARAFVDQMRRARESLGRFPEMGFIAENPLVPGSRRLVVGAYYVDYDVQPDQIVVTAISPARKPEITLALDDDEDYETELKSDGHEGP